MIQRVGNGENKINLMEVDWEKVDQEVNQINEKYNAPKEQRCRTAKQSSGNMYAHKNQYRINFLEGNNIPEPEKKTKEDIDFDKQSPKRLNSEFQPDNLLQNGSSVHSASSSPSGETNFGGPKKQIKTETSNSIWDSERLEQVAQQLDSKTRVQKEKQAQQEQREALRQKEQEELLESTKDIDTRKQATLSPLSGSEAIESGKTQSRNPENMSVFDYFEGNQNFNRLPEKTAGEKLSEKRAQMEAERQADQSWKGDGKAKSTADVRDRLFDALMGNDKE